jgi:hypothetical protein
MNTESKSLAVQALEESVDQLRTEVECVRHTNKVLRLANGAARRRVTDLMKQIEDTNKHLFDLAASELGEDFDISDNQISKP